jgi:hypothetical protein
MTTILHLLIFMLMLVAPAAFATRFAPRPLTAMSIGKHHLLAYTRRSQFG